MFLTVPGTAHWAAGWLQPQKEPVYGQKMGSPTTMVLFVPDRTDPKLSDMGGAIPEISAIFGSGPLNKMIAQPIPPPGWEYSLQGDSS